jgi:hypothetical protein
MSTHATAQQLVDYVIGASSPADVSALEGHVSSCDDCRERLAAEAELELSLHEVAAAAPKPAMPLVHPPHPRLEQSLLAQPEPRRTHVLLPALLAASVTAALLAVGFLKVNGQPVVEPPPTPPTASAPQTAFAAEAFAPPDERTYVAPSTGTLRLQAQPPAKVHVDGVDRGWTPQTLEVEVGTHHVVFEHDAERKRYSVEVEAGADRRVYSRSSSAPVRSARRGFANRPLAADEGQLQIFAVPFAHVTIDGEEKGATPIMPLAVKAGEHRVTLKFNDRVYASDVKVEPGEVAVVKVDMREQKRAKSAKAATR